MRARTTAINSLGRLRALFGLFALAFLAAQASEASPSFELYISTGGVRELAVGQTLALRALHPPPTCLPPPYTGKKKAPAPPAKMEIVWSVEPAALATISKEGVLTAVGEGMVTVTVACRNPKAPECALTSPGQTSISLSKKLASARLPLLDGGPAIEEFYLQWDATPFQSRHELGLTITGAGFAWAAGLKTPTLPDGPFPWALVPDRDHRYFSDEEGYDEHSEARHRAFVTDARLAITSWKDGILSGHFELKTTRGVEIDTTFQSRLADRDGVLAKAAGLPPEPAAATPTPGVGMK